MDSPRPNTSAILAQLKDFQRDTVEHVFRRMYVDVDSVRRFLVADEVGLGKTLVARGLIARVIDFLWQRDERIDVVYVCSNSDIARQNINRLNVTGNEDFSLSSRITLLPITIGHMQHRRINFISFTPGTSFEVGNRPGWSLERQLLYWLLKEPWSLSFNKATCVLHATAGIDGFREQVRSFPEWYAIHPVIAAQFAERLEQNPCMRERYEELCEQIPRAGAALAWELNQARNKWIGDLRRLLAQTCLHWLKPDMIILDEFQRFKHLVQGDTEEASEAAQLAHHLFNYQRSQEDPLTAARVLLLSATPYKMYTLSHEAEQDDHYADFRNTLDFLLPDEGLRHCIHGQLQHYREELLRIGDDGINGLLDAKRELERSLRQVMVRTERLALKEDRNGMLKEIVPETVTLTPGDVQHYLGMQRVARALRHDDLMEYWKSAPYLLNFMEDYDLKRKLRAKIDADVQDVDVVRAVRHAQPALLDREHIEAYRRVDPANARLRGLHHELVERGAWRLLWMPPSLPYYQGVDAYANPDVAEFTKRLVFSCWRVAPKAVAAVLSYEAERSMIHSYRRKARNTVEARKKRRPLLKVTFSKGRPTGMPVLGLVYPCWTLAEQFDPLRLMIELASSGQPPTLEGVLQHVEARLEPLVAQLRKSFGGQSVTPDESWYWAAPLLLDVQSDRRSVKRWFSRDDLADIWAGEVSHEDESHTGWHRHVQLAKRMAAGKDRLGAPPADLVRTLALMAIAGPGVTAMRMLKRILPDTPRVGADGLRTFAAPLAYAFLSLFNLPEVMALVRDRAKGTPYWYRMLEYCAAGNLQSVLDEFAHLLIESLGLLGKKPTKIADDVSRAIRHCLTMRTSTAQADVIIPGKRSVRMGEPLRLRTRFAMRFGDQDAEESVEPTRADQVRAAFNSPFWPFVLATTSVGQEGLDFHMYCHAVVHWNLPSNPVDLEQREGRVHRYKGHALRKNIARKYASELGNGTADPWAAMFDAARRSRPTGQNDLFPYWVAPDGAAKIERHIPALPLSREASAQGILRNSLVIYRMVFGQNRQEDLVDFLLSRLPPEEIPAVVDSCRIDLSPPRS